MATHLIHAVFIATVTLLATAATVHPAPGYSTPASAKPALYVWRVFVRDDADVLQLTSGEWDVLESRGEVQGADYLLVLGDDAVAVALRAQGFRVEVDEIIDTPDIPTPHTYYNGYRTVGEHEQHLDEVVAAHPELAQRVDYGDSWRKEQGRANGHDLLALCLTKLRPGDCTPSVRSDKARLLIIAGVHARELVPPELAWRWIDELVNGYDVDPDITALLDYNEVWVIPQANPDGRTIVEQGGSSPLMQRKNANSSYGSCGTPGIGVDLNRNASFHWGGSGASSSPCSELYRGPRADSEPETTALQTLMLGLFDDQRGPALADKAPMTTTGLVLNLHSYGNLVMLPWDYTTAHAPNDAELRSIAFRLSYHNGYRAGQYPEVLYLSSGTQDDWSYGQLGVPNLTFEVGTTFMPAYSLVNSTYWPQNRGALRYAAQIARQPYSLAPGPAAIVSTLSPTNTQASTPVTLTAWIDDQRYGNAGVGQPASQIITQAEVYVDTPPWLGGQPIAMRPADGSFNSAKEQVVAVIDTSLNKGRHRLFVRGRDSSGDWGPVAAAWLFLSAAPYYTLSGIVTDRISGDPLAATLILTGVMSVTSVITGEITATPFVSTTLADPATGNYSLTVASGHVDEVTVTASEYHSKTQAINACDGCPGDQADFALLGSSITDRAYLPLVMRPVSGEADLQ